MDERVWMNYCLNSICHHSVSDTVYIEVTWGDSYVRDNVWVTSFRLSVNKVTSQEKIKGYSLYNGIVLDFTECAVSNIYQESSGNTSQMGVIIITSSGHYIACRISLTCGWSYGNRFYKCYY